MTLGSGIIGKHPEGGSDRRQNNMGKAESNGQQKTRENKKSKEGLSRNLVKVSVPDTARSKAKKKTRENGRQVDCHSDISRVIIPRQARFRV